jgi:hypothetical protein
MLIVENELQGKFGGAEENRMGRVELLKPIVDAAFRRYETTPLPDLSEVEQTVMLVWSLRGEVGNGGFDQFYFNSSGDYAAETVRALETIGAKQTAALVSEGNRLFPTQPVPTDRERRIAELDTFSDSVTDTWDRLERVFYTDPDRLDELVVAYLVHRGVLSASASDCVEPNPPNCNPGLCARNGESLA